MGDPLVSIYCLAYNHAPYIRKCLDGFLMQKTNFPFEVIVHDDASTDGTADIIRKYEEKHPDIVKPIYQYENQYSKKINISFTYIYPRCRGKYIAVCEGDDYWTDPCKLQEQVDFLETHPDFSVCTGGFLINKNGGELTEQVIKRGDGHGFEYTDQRGWYWKTLTRVYRKDALQECARNFRKYKYFRDRHLFYYLLKSGKGWYFSKVFGVYNIHPGGIWGGLTHEQQLRTGYNVFKELYHVTRDAEMEEIWHFKIGEVIKHKLYKNRFERIKLLFEYYNYNPETRRIAVKKIIKKILHRIPFAWETLNILRGKRGTGIKFKLANVFDRRLNGSLKNGLLRFMITTGCNCRCRFCGPSCGTEANPRVDIDKKILYEYCLPLYKKVKCVFLTGGEPLIVPETFDFCIFLSKEYPKVNIFLESNGIAFDEKWQKLAADNLLGIHFSINGSNEDAFLKGCWTEGGTAYNMAQKNILSYQNLLRENQLEVFAPNVTTVINRESAGDFKDFLKYSLIHGFRNCGFLFDYKETNMNEGTFNAPEIMHGIYHELLKLERLLAGKFLITFRLFRPLKSLGELEKMEEDVRAIPFENLKKDYADIWELAKDRSIKNEFMKRNEIRKQRGKKQFSYDEEYKPWTYKYIGNEPVCFVPFTVLNIRSTGVFDACVKNKNRFDINTIINRGGGGGINWDKEFINHPVMRKWRYDVLHNDWSFCQKSCPYQFPYKPGFNSKEALFSK